jgi:hypothetical protein
MVVTVALWRLDRVKIGKDANGKRLYVDHKVTAADWQAIRNGVMTAMGFAVSSA